MNDLPIIHLTPPLLRYGIGLHSLYYKTTLARAKIPTLELIKGEDMSDSTYFPHRYTILDRTYVIFLIIF